MGVFNKHIGQESNERVSSRIFPIFGRNQDKDDAAGKIEAINKLLNCI